MLGRRRFGSGRLTYLGARETERAAAALFRAGYHRWRAAAFSRALSAPHGLLLREPRPAGVDGLSGLRFSDCTGQRGHEGHGAPTPGEAVALGYAVAMASARFWLRQAGGTSERARVRGLGVPE